MLEKPLESPLNYKEIKPVNPKGNQSCIFIGRTDVEAEAPILWPLMQRTDSLEKTLMLGKIEDSKKVAVSKTRRDWRNQTYHHLHLRLPASTTVRKLISFV